MDKIYQAAVIGLGRIGSSYPSTDILRTHTAAYSENSRIIITAAVDSDQKKREEFLQTWGSDIPVFSNVHEMLSEVHPEIVSICVSPPFLTDIIMKFRENSPRLYYLEKPVVSDPDNALLLQATINNVPAAVNYHRCWDPSHIRFFNRVLESGRVITIRVIYGKGMFNYASHIIALFIKYFGSVINVKTLPVNTHNITRTDPSFSFILEFEAVFPAVFQGIDELPYDLLEVEIMTTSGLYSLKSAGCRRRQELPQKDAFYPDYTQLIDVPTAEPDGQVEGLKQAVENMVRYLDGKDDKLSCDLPLALEVFEVLWQVKQSCNN